MWYRYTKKGKISQPGNGRIELSLQMDKKR